MCWAYGTQGEGQKYLKILVRKSAGRRPLWRPARRFEDNGS